MWRKVQEDKLKDILKWGCLACSSSSIFMQSWFSDSHRDDKAGRLNHGLLTAWGRKASLITTYSSWWQVLILIACKELLQEHHVDYLLQIPWRLPTARTHFIANSRHFVLSSRCKRWEHGHWLERNRILSWASRKCSFAFKTETCVNCSITSWARISGISVFPSVQELWLGPKQFDDLKRKVSPSQWASPSIRKRIPGWPYRLGLLPEDMPGDRTAEGTE